VDPSTPTKPTAPAGPAAPGTPSPLSVAAAATQAKKTGNAVKITSVASPTRQALANPDGTLTVNVNALSARVNHAGVWIGLDATLTRNPDGTYSPTASASGPNSN
jgi:hypothetical protein